MCDKELKIAAESQHGARLQCTIIGEIAQMLHKLAKPMDDEQDREHDGDDDALNGSN